MALAPEGVSCGSPHLMQFTVMALGTQSVSFLAKIFFVVFLFDLVFVYIIVVFVIFVIFCIFLCVLYFNFFLEFMETYFPNSVEKYSVTLGKVWWVKPIILIFRYNSRAMGWKARFSWMVHLL